MIFVTVGTHEQPFNRLVKAIDELKENGIVTEDVVIQTGFSTYEPRFCRWSRLFPYQEMAKNVEEARIVITHGGPSSFIMPLQIGKIPIVVPRQKQFNEHVKEVAEKMGTIIPVYDIETLKDVLLKYEQIVSAMPSGMQSHNETFNHRFSELVNEMF